MVFGAHWYYSQLSSCSVHTCRSMGYLVRSMLQAIVAVMLQRGQSENIRQTPALMLKVEIKAAPDQQS